MNLSSAQNCTGDSVIITTRYDDIYDQFTYIITDTFDINTGLKTTCTSKIDGSGNITLESCTTQTFVRVYIERNQNMDTLTNVRMQGTGSGFVNFKKTEFTYQPIIEKPSSRIEYLWDGSNWIPKYSETWTYDINNKLTDYLFQYDSGTGLQNIKRSTYTNISPFNTELVFQEYQLGNWINTQKYLIVSDSSGARDSLYIQFWQQGNNSWHDSIAAVYGFNGADYGAEVTWINIYLDADSNLINFTLIEIIDTSDNIISKEFPGLYNYSYSHYQYYNYTQLTNTDNSDYYGCVNYDSYFFNNNGILTGSFYHGACSMPSSGNSSYSYDSLYRLTKYYHESIGNIGTYIYHYETYYSDFNQIGLSYLDLMQYGGHFCPGSTLRVVPLVSGGCGPYRFQWSPSTGLSSDTVADPIVTIPNDTMTYSITVSDSIGNSTTSTFDVFPYEIMTPIITFQSPLLVSSSALNYQWYYNGVILPNDTNLSIQPVNSGTYSVSTHDYFGCQSAITDFFYVQTKTPETSLSDISIYPNPADKEIILRGISNASELFLCDLTGKKIAIGFEKETTSDYFKFNCSMLANGIYFLRIIKNDFSSDRKIIIQHN